MPEPEKPAPNRTRPYLINGLIAFLLGILGNLIASFILQDGMGDQFTPFGIFLIIAFTVAGLVYTAWQERRHATDVQPTSETEKDVDIQDNTLVGSKVKTRGKGIRVKRNTALKSEIDVDVREDK
ncbi:MAG: hypothetical protein M9930_21015 [Anaerolineae bacterium]|nr:hypothetical protein [Anaerolineae bacterium]